MTARIALAAAGLFLFVLSVHGQRLRMVAKIGTHGCESRDFMLKFHDAIFDNDKQAISIAVMAMVAANTCVEVAEGEEVIVLDTEWFGGMLKFRKPGYLGSYYGIHSLFEIGRGRANPKAKPKPAIAPRKVKSAPSKPAKLAMTGGWKCRDGQGQAMNTAQSLALTKSSLSPGRTVLGLMTPDPWLSSNTPQNVDFSVNGGPSMLRHTQLGHPEIILDDDLVAELKRGMDVSISIYSEEGGVHRYSASLIGFTRAYNCVTGSRMESMAQAAKTERPKGSSINREEARMDERDEKILQLEGHVIALQSALEITIRGLAGAISSSSDNSDAVRESIERTFAEGFQRLSEEGPDPESSSSARSDDARVRITAAKSLLGNLSKRIAK